MQIELCNHNETIVPIRNPAVRGYGHLSHLSNFGQRLVKAAYIRPGENVLVMACGPGAVLLPAAEQVGRRGKVIGIDHSPAVVENANALIRAGGQKNAIVLPMDAGRLEFPAGIFDHVLCAFALPFLSTPAAVLREFLRVLRPGGSLAVSTWGPRDDRWSWYDAQLRRYGAARRLAPRTLDGAAQVSGLIRQAGFRHVTVQVETYHWVYVSEEEWWSTMWNDPNQAALHRLSPVTLEKFRAEAFRKMQPLRKPDGFHMLLEADFVSGSKPFWQRR